MKKPKFVLELIPASAFERKATWYKDVLLAQICRPAGGYADLEVAPTGNQFRQWSGCSEGEKGDYPATP